MSPQAWDLIGDEEKYYVQQELHRLQDGNLIQPFELEVGTDREHFLKLCFMQRLKEKLHLVCERNRFSPPPYLLMSLFFWYD